MSSAWNGRPGWNPLGAGSIPEVGVAGFGTLAHPEAVPVDIEMEKQLAAEEAATLVENGMRVGLGTGSTVAYLLPALAKRKLVLRCVATSPATEEAARRLGLIVEPFTFDRLDMAIDGADQISPEGWLVKGGGAAHTREKLVAVSADRFVVIADSAKPVAALHAPVPLELLAFGLASTLERLGPVRLRDVPPSPDGGIIADFTGAVGDPADLASRLGATPGVVDHGLFPPPMVTTVLVGRGRSVDRITVTDA
jgi:ribose 5-phosphate isomerase A